MSGNYYGGAGPQYPYQGPQAPQPYPQHPHAPYHQGHGMPPAGPPGPPGPLVPHGQAARRSRAPMGIALTLVLLAAGVGGFLLFGGGDDDGDVSEAAADPELEAAMGGEMAFPDAGGFNYEQGPEATCETIAERMIPRGYAPAGVVPEHEGPGVACLHLTPGTSSIEEGTYDLTATVSLTRGSQSQAAYDGQRDDVVAYWERHAENPEDMGDFYDFPVGDEGFLAITRHTGFPLAASTAFRSGDDTFTIDIDGYVVGDLGSIGPHPPDEVVKNEAVAIARALSGDEAAGEPQITPGDLAAYEGLPELGEPLPADSGADRCAGLTAISGELAVRSSPDSPEFRESKLLCRYGFDPDYDLDEPVVREVSLTATYTGRSEWVDARLPRAEGLVKEEVRSIRSGDYDGTPGTLYELPIGSSGYMVHLTVDHDDGGGHAELLAGYVLGDVAVSIIIDTYTRVDGTATPMPEAEMVNTLVQILAALDG